MQVTKQCLSTRSPLFLSILCNNMAGTLSLVKHLEALLACLSMRGNFLPMPYEEGKTAQTLSFINFVHRNSTMSPEVTISFPELSAPSLQLSGAFVTLDSSQGKSTNVKPLEPCGTGCTGSDSSSSGIIARSTRESSLLNVPGT